MMTLPMADEFCPICLVPAPANTPRSRDHMATHSREELVTAFGALKADFADALRTVRDETRDR
jgi:hypothetical protein